ncbi:MAG: hypothetical protein HZC37_02195 [Burkholderiales bacterium]|nr:hypothetical protein [Burkholderiales bacterium]
MALQLKTVTLGHGPRWVVDGFRAFARRPLALGLLFLVFLAASAIVAAVLPFVGSLLQLMALPLLSLGYMVATQSALLGGPVHPGQFIEPLRADPVRRRSLLVLCVSYGLLAFAILVLCAWVSDDALARLQALVAKGDPTRTQIEALLDEPGVTSAAWLLGVLGTALSVPFWFAPALVHWGGQGVGQSLFSSTMALWRNKGAFTTFVATWVAVVTLVSVLLSMLLAALGAARFAGMMLMPMALLFSSVFYVSQLFAFNDNFGGAGAAADEPTGPPPTKV